MKEQNCEMPRPFSETPKKTLLTWASVCSEGLVLAVGKDAIILCSSK